MRKVLSLLMVALLSTAFLFAGGSNESSDGPVVINHWYWVPNADVARYTEMIDEFNRTHTDVQVNWENVPQDDVRTRFITAFQIGEGPDTFGMGGNWIPEFQAMGMLEPLNDYIDNWDQKDEIIVYHGHQFKILEVDNRRIKKIQYLRIDVEVNDNAMDENQ